MTALLIATRNRHKVEEIRAILGGEFRFLTLSDFSDAPNVVEDAATFAGNATKKAVELSRWFSTTRHSSLLPRHSEAQAGVTRHSFVLADDSGLEVDALNGAPGVQSARFAAENKTSGNSSDAVNNEKLLRLLKDVPPERRTARFRCVLALTPVVPPSPEPASLVCYADEAEMRTELFDGVCEGRIAFESRGQNGFGYDPLFSPDGYQQTFAELGEAAKNTFSHRARALAKLKQRLDLIASSAAGPAQ